jgi:hypothetical protein
MSFLEQQAREERAREASVTQTADAQPAST